MPKAVINTEFTIRKITVEDIKEIYKLLIDNRPYVGLNSRYTYFLLAKDFSDTCIVALDGDKVIACLLYTSPSPRDRTRSRMPSSA